MIYRRKNLVDELQSELLGGVVEQSTIIKINGENLHANGEIYFPINLFAWRDLISPDVNADKCRNILEHYLRRKNVDTVELSENDIVKEAMESLIAASKTWSASLRKYKLDRGRIFLFLDRRKIIETAIKDALRLGINYGKRESVGRSVDLKIVEDRDSDLTTARLRLVKQVTERVLKIQGFQIDKPDADIRYSLTTKSEGPVESGYQRYVCGVVRNQHSTTKETSITWALYMDKKIHDLAALAESRQQPEFNVKTNLQKIAQAVVTFELLAVSPSRSVFVQSSTDLDKTSLSYKGGTFLLYNAARMSAILERFKQEECLGNYPNLLDINNVDFELLNQEEEWDLVYSFVLGYPEMIENCVSCEKALETRPQTLCLFLSQLCKRFSLFYRRVRILTERRDHLVPTMMARLYLLRALQIVMNNSLEILNIVPVQHM